MAKKVRKAKYVPPHRLETSIYTGSITRARVDILERIIASGHPDSGLCVDELNRRGGLVDKNIIIKPHAINRASQVAMHIFITNAKKNEGLFSFLQRIVKEALEENENHGTYFRYLGLKLVIKYDGDKRILTTVVPV